MLGLVSLTKQNLNELKQPVAHYAMMLLTGMFMLPYFMQKQSSGHTDASLCISTTAASASACLEGVVGLSSAFELCF